MDPKATVHLTNSQGFPPDIPKGLIVELGDGRRLRVVRVESATVLTLGPIRWWHHRFWKPFLMGLLGLAVGYGIQWLARYL